MKMKTNVKKKMVVDPCGLLECTRLEPSVLTDICHQLGLNVPLRTKEPFS